MAIDTVVVQDVIVVIPGIMGSELADADGKTVWSVSPGGLIPAIRALASQRLVLPRDLGDGPAPDGIRAVRPIRGLHVIPGLWSPVTGYEGLLSYLRSWRFHLLESDPSDRTVVPNLIPFAYDWRLSNRHNGRRLAEVALPALERWRRQPGMGEAKLVLVCHSMGGLVARWFAHCEGGADAIRAMITIGTPHRGALRALTALVNGLDPGIGPLRLPLSDMARSLPSLYQLVPQYDCLYQGDRRVGLLDASCPHLDDHLVRDAAAFHAAINAAGPHAYTLHKVVGVQQPTPTTARVLGDKVEPCDDIDGRNQGGDGTVPRLAAEPEAGRGSEVHEIADQHGELQGTRSLFDLLYGILSREQIIWQAGPQQAFGVRMADVWATDQPPTLEVNDPGNRRIHAVLHDEIGRTIQPSAPVPADGIVRFGILPEGAYRAVLTLSGRDPLQVGKAFLVMSPNAPA